MTGGFSISAGRAAMRTSLGVKGSQVQILSSRRRDRAVSPTEMPPDLRSELGKRAPQMITVDLQSILPDGRLPLACAYLEQIWSTASETAKWGQVLLQTSEPVGDGSVTVQRTSRRMTLTSSADDQRWRGSQGVSWSVVAVAALPGSQRVRGSNPLSSTLAVTSARGGFSQVRPGVEASRLISL